MAVRQIVETVEDSFVADDHGDALAVVGLCCEQPLSAFFKYCHLNKDMSGVVILNRGRHCEKSLSE